LENLDLKLFGESAGVSGPPIGCKLAKFAGWFNSLNVIKLVTSLVADNAVIKLKLGAVVFGINNLVLSVENICGNAEHTVSSI